MAPINVPRFRYNDPVLTPPEPGRALIFAVGLVESVPGVGPKSGGQHFGVPLTIGPKNTRLRRLHDNIEVTLPNGSVQLWASPFRVAGHALGEFALSRRPGWHWLRWTIADHVEHDLRTSATQGDSDSDRPLVVITCGGTKADQPAPACQLYTSTYHRLCQRAAMAMTNRSSIRILSAKHGLLRVDDIVEPYDLRLRQPGAITATELAVQAFDQGLLERSSVVALGGRDYMSLARAVWPHVTTPLAGSRGIGDQQQRLVALASTTHQLPGRVRVP